MTELPLPREAYDMWASKPIRYVLVHGLGGDRTQWRALAEHLTIRSGVLAIDLAGQWILHIAPSILPRRSDPSLPCGPRPRTSSADLVRHRRSTRSRYLANPHAAEKE